MGSNGLKRPGARRRSGAAPQARADGVPDAVPERFSGSTRRTSAGRTAAETPAETWLGPVACAGALASAPAVTGNQSETGTAAARGGARSWAGPRAEAPRCSRMRRMTRPSVMKATTRITPRQRESRKGWTRSPCRRAGGRCVRRENLFIQRRLRRAGLSAVVRPPAPGSPGRPRSETSARGAGQDSNLAARRQNGGGLCGRCNAEKWRKGASQPPPPPPPLWGSRGRPSHQPPRGAGSLSCSDGIRRRSV